MQTYEIYFLQHSYEILSFVPGFQSAVTSYKVTLFKSFQTFTSFCLSASVSLHLHFVF